MSEFDIYKIKIKAIRYEPSSEEEKDFLLLIEQGRDLKSEIWQSHPWCDDLVILNCEKLNSDELPLNCPILYTPSDIKRRLEL